MKKGFALGELIFVVFVLVAAVLFGTFAWKELTKPSPISSVYSIERPLKQFAVNQGDPSDSFFLATGSISGGEKEYYFCYKTKEDNKFRAASVPLNKASIVEDGQNKVVFVTKPLNQEFEDEKQPNIERNIDSGYFGYIIEIEFHIPPGSILEEYNPNFSSSF